MKKLGFGMMRLPVTEPGNNKTIDQELVNKMVDRFLSEGFTYIDTAYPYHQGLSESAVRKALVERYPRDSFLLADKMPTFLVNSAEDYPRFLQNNLNAAVWTISIIICYIRSERKLCKHTEIWRVRLYGTAEIRGEGKAYRLFLSR